ncbi:MAG: peptidylprolyl isomerase [Syntrophales bacterium]|jgi:parvulin-like peptidyl-prolyl isomerase|nr:peptidylprolyl isomerase [Syntrophales bacterium]MCK9528406.1 peptidylprolyl isomerase [Syntrophales bacterium]MDX9922429.1 peptidylprolyl isomerase [Syntrophales bacterium]
MKSSSTVGGFLLVALLILLVSPLYAHTDRVVAVVNNDIITLEELNRHFAPFLQRIEADPRTREDESVMQEGRRLILDRMIRELLMKQEAERLNIVVRDDDVDSYIEETLTESAMTRRDLLTELSRENSSFEEYRESVRRDIMKARLIGREIRAKVHISEEDIGAYYREHRDLYEGKGAVRIQQIFTEVPRGSDDDAREELKARAEAIHEQLMAGGGESFDTLARQYAQGARARTGGDMGFIEKGTILPEVESVAFALGRGEVSGVIESPAGFHIIRVLDKRGSGLKPLEEVRQEIIDTIGEKRMEERFQEWLEDLKEKSYVDVRL